MTTWICIQSAEGRVLKNEKSSQPCLSSFSLNHLLNSGISIEQSRTQISRCSQTGKGINSFNPYLSRNNILCIYITNKDIVLKKKNWLIFYPRITWKYLLKGQKDNSCEYQNLHFKQNSQVIQMQSLVDSLRNNR